MNRIGRISFFASERVMAEDVVKQLAPEQLIAVSKIGTEAKLKDARKLLKDGREYKIDFGIRLTGKLSVAARQGCMYSTKPTSVQLVAMLLAELGPRKRSQLVDALIANRTESLVKDREPELLLLAERLIGGLTLSVPGKKNGNVTGDFNIDLIAWS
jgi:hypothetical protein